MAAGCRQGLAAALEPPAALQHPAQQQHSSVVRPRWQQNTVAKASNTQSYMSHWSEECRETEQGVGMHAACCLLQWRLQTP
jgi:hypothetical protein